MASEVPPDLPQDTLASYNPERSRMLAATVISDSGDRTIPEEDIPNTSPTKSIELPHPSLSRWSVVIDSDDGGEAAPALLPQANFRLKEMVGRGGFGEVWEARQASLDRIVAVKRLRKDISSDGDDEDTAARRRSLEVAFRQEAITTANLDHPNIVPVHDLGVDEDGSSLLAMKYVRGTPWNKMIAADFVSLSPIDFLARHIPILIDVAQAVAFAHARGVVHRDLKPSQVIVGEFGETMLMDWGLAVIFDLEVMARHCDQDSCELLPTIHNATNPAGTLAFMAPEQTERHARNIGPWTDVYLLGGTLYYLLCGRLPHRGEDPRTVFLKAKIGEFIPPEEAEPGREIPPELSDLARHAMMADRNARVGSAREFFELLQDWLSGASKRRESIRLSDEVTRELDTCDARYDVLADSLAKVEQSAALWGDNPSVPALRQRATAMFARTALENGDLVLARLQTGNLQPGQTRDEIALRIDELEKRQRTRERQRRVFLVGSIFFLAVILLVVAVFNRRFLEERDFAREEARRVREARNDAQRLVNFMMEDLLEELQPMGRLDPIREVSSRVLQYYDNVPGEEMRPEVALQHARALRAVGLVEYESGNSRGALEYLTKAAQLFDEAAAAPTSSVTPARDRVFVYLLLASVQADRNDLKAATASLSRALLAFSGSLHLMPAGDAIRAILPPPEELRVYTSGDADPAAIPRLFRLLLEASNATFAADPDQRVEFSTTVALNSLGDLAFSGIPEPQLMEAVVNARRFRREAAEANPQNIAVAQGYLISSYRLGDLYRKAGDLTGAVAVVQEALDFALEREARSPGQYQWKQAASEGRGRLGLLHLESGNMAMARAYLRDAVADAEALVERDPQNALWQYNLAVRQREAGDLALAGGDLSGALDDFTAAQAISDRLYSRDPENYRWRRDFNGLFEGLFLLASQAREGDAPEVAREAARRAFDMARLDEGLRPGAPEIQRNVIAAADVYTRVLLEEGDGAAASRVLEFGLSRARLRAGGSTGDPAYMSLLARLLLLEAAQGLASGDTAAAWNSAETAARRHCGIRGVLDDELQEWLRPLRLEDPNRWDALLDFAPNGNPLP